MSIADSLAAVGARLEAARARSPRAAPRSSIVAVSKRHPSEAIAEAIAAGQLDFGENYAVEMTAKIEALASLEARWHFIGHLQRNKVNKVVGCYLIHAVDSERLLRAIDRRAGETGRRQDVLVAVSLAGEAQKSGVDRAACRGLVELAAALEHVRCRGLMTMPPLVTDAEDNRAVFAELRELRDALASDEQPLEELSMGTTGDFEIAVEEGATLLRIGTAIFGQRPS